MRTRLAVILFIPIVIVLLLLGTAYTSSVARANQQAVYLDRLRDSGYLVLVARQSLTSDDPAVVHEDLHRYGEVYDIDATVFDRTGELWATNGLEADVDEERLAALAGRRSEHQASFLPWEVDRIVVAEPVFDGEDLVGAVVTASEADHLSRGLWVTWGLLALSVLVACLLALLIANRTARWVLRPVAAVDRAMAEVEHGHLGARIPISTGPPELRAVIARFNEMSSRVEHTVHKNQEFVANASHELRNPLNALMLRVDGLAMSVPDDVADEMASVRGEAMRMASILDALLLLADEGRPDVESEPVEVVTLVAGRVENWRHLARGRAVELGTRREEEWVRGSVSVLESALDAVLDNAVKYSPADVPIEVSVNGSDGVVEVAVRDHGPGVSADELERLTERFWRSPGHRRVQGSGLGLSIASELLATGGGTLGFALPDDGGLRVCLRVPRNGELT